MEPSSNKWSYIMKNIQITHKGQNLVEIYEINQIY